MGKIRWYKRDPDAALSGMFELTLEERGAYNTVLDLIYARANSLPDDDRFIAGWLKADVRVWRRIKERLIGLGKLRVADGLICNDRADVEVLEALGRVLSASEAGRASGNSRRHKSAPKDNKINGVAQTGVSTERERTLELTTTTTTEEEVSESRDSLVNELRPEHVVEAWNEMAGRLGLAKVRKLSPQRLSKLKLRLREHSVDDFTEAISAIERSSFLRGDSRDGWRADFDFLLQPSSFLKLIEGSYDRAN